MGGCKPQKSNTTQLYEIYFNLCTASGRYTQKTKVRLCQKWVKRRAKAVQISITRQEVRGGEERRMKRNEKREGRGVVTEMREKLYQSDQSSVHLQSPDKAGTAGGETMCIKTSWRSMASFCQLWETQKRMSARNKRKRREEEYLN